MKKLKNILISLISLLVFLYIVLAILYQTNPKDYFELSYKIFKSLPDKYQVGIKLFKDENYINNLNNDYNTKHLPETQFLNLKFEKIKLNFVSNSKTKYLKNLNQKQTFFIDLFENNLLITDSKGNIFLINEEDIKKKKIKQTKIDNNLKLNYVLDALIYENKFFVSFTDEKNNCETMNVAFAEVNYKFLNFKNLLTSSECGKNIQGGRMQRYKFLNKEGILLTTGDNISDLPSFNAQDEGSIFGKILFISLEKKSLSIFSNGHRNPQGLIVKDKIILSTEHGPKGGDEINRIIYGKNYGWPIANYGESYANENLTYKKSHKQNNFEEPIFSYIPSIGISEIISIPNSFSNKWQNNFLISSLNGKSLFRVQFNTNFSKLMYQEKIFIGQRIRDMKFNEKLNSIILSLEDGGEFGIISIQ